MAFFLIHLSSMVVCITKWRSFLTNLGDVQQLISSPFSVSQDAGILSGWQDVESSLVGGNEVRERRWWHKLRRRVLLDLPKPKMLEYRLEMLQWGRNIVLIWGITKPFQQNEVLCYTCKEFRALKANVIFKVAYSLNIEQGTSFSEKVWWYLKSKLCCGPTVTFPI